MATGFAAGNSPGQPGKILKSGHRPGARPQGFGGCEERRTRPGPRPGLPALPGLTRIAHVEAVGSAIEQGGPCKGNGAEGAGMSSTTQASLDMRGKTITTFIAYEALRQLAGLADGETLELVTDASEEVDNDIRAWCRTRGQELAATGHTDGCQRYVITKRPLRPSGKRYAAGISDPVLEELLSPLAFALAAALEGTEVSLYFRGRRYGSWPKASPSTYAGRLLPSARSARP